MLFLLSGASGSGKKTVAPLVIERVNRLVSHHEGEIPAFTRRERMANMERWLETAAAYETKGDDLLLLTTSQEIGHTVDVVSRWIERTRAGGTSLSRAAHWWEQ